MRTYSTKSGDMFDAIAKELYGSEQYADVLMRANPQYAGVFRFSAGCKLTVPKIDTSVTFDDLPPWKRVQS